MLRAWLPSLFLLLILHRGWFFLKTDKNLLGDGEICVGNLRCRSLCCRRSPDPDSCEAHCTPRSPEGGKCSKEVFFGQYYECPCESNLTCIHPKNQKTFKMISGNCQKHKKPSKKTGFYAGHGGAHL